MKLARALEDKNMDLRLRDKLVHEGKLTKEQVKDYLESLPDDSANATTLDKTEGENGEETSAE